MLSSKLKKKALCGRKHTERNSVPVLLRPSREILRNNFTVGKLVVAYGSAYVHCCSFLWEFCRKFLCGIQFTLSRVSQENSTIVGYRHHKTEKAPILPAEASPPAWKHWGSNLWRRGLELAFSFVFVAFTLVFVVGGVLLLHISVAFFR